MKKLLIGFIALSSMSGFAGVCEKELRDCKDDIRDGFSYYLCVPQSTDQYDDLDAFCNTKRRSFKRDGIAQCEISYLNCDENHDYQKPQQQVRP